MTRVLIINDSNVMGTMLRDAIEAHDGLTVVGSTRGADEGLTVIEECGPDIVLINLLLPYIDGARLLSMLASRPALTKVVVSSQMRSRVEQKLVALGASALLEDGSVTSDPAGFCNKLLSVRQTDLAQRSPSLRGQAAAQQYLRIRSEGRFPIPGDEALRLQRLAKLQVANDDVDPCLDIIVRRLADQVGFPFAAVCVMDAEKSWSKAALGFSRGAYARDQSLCAHTLCAAEPTIVTDASTHPVFRHMDLVTGDPHIRSYAGVPIVAPDGLRLGTLCVADSRPRLIPDHVVSALLSAAGMAAEFLELENTGWRRTAA